MKPRQLGVCLVAAHLAAAAAAAGQINPDGLLRGTVRDETGAVIVNAVVVVASPQLIGGARTLATDADGQWRTPALPPGEYTVNITAPGFEPAARNALHLWAGATLIVDVQLALAPFAERAIVEQSRPVVDVTSPSITFTLNQSVLRGLPTSRSFWDLINLAPGVAGEQAFGGTKRSNGLIIDGLDTTESSEQNPWLRFTQNWLQEVQVVGLGAGAEYGLSTGVTAYGLIRSGTNRYAGLTEAWAVPGAWVANNTRALSQSLQRQFASARIDSFWNTNGQIGGPIRRDRVWFFSGLDHTTNEGAPAGYQGSDNQRERDTRAIGKLTANGWRGARLEGFIQGGRRRIRNFGLNRQRPAEAAPHYQQPQLSGTFRVIQPVGRSVSLDIHYAGWHSPDQDEPQAPGSRNGPPGRYDQLSGTYSVNADAYNANHRWRQSMAAAGSWYGSIRGLSHEARFGLQVERAREETTFGFPGGRLYLDEGPRPSLVLLADESVRRGDTARLTFWLQDRLHLGSRITVSPGLRLDRFRWSTAETRNVLATNPLSPRLGLAWDVQKNHRTVVRAHYGRVTDSAFAQPVLLTDYAQVSVQILARVVAPDVFEEISRQDFRGRIIDPDIDHSFIHQYVGGVEHQLWDDITVLGQYIHREFESFITEQPRNLMWLPVERRDPGPDGIQGTGDDGATYTVYSRVATGPSGSVYTNLDEGWRRYRAAQVVIRTTANGPWQMQASYTRSQTEGTVTTNLHANAGVRFTNLHPHNPNRLINGHASTGFDPTNELKVLTVWQPQRWTGWVFSGVYRHLTGGAWGRTFFATGLPQGNEAIRAEPRGTHRLPAINQLDLHVEQVIRLGDRKLGAFADVFNVWNQGVPDSEWGDVVISNSGPNLGVPQLWRPPRQVRIGLSLTF